MVVLDGKGIGIRIHEKKELEGGKREGGRGRAIH
jgi:hypothetical protein